jgi:hypothetical protein
MDPVSEHRFEKIVKLVKKNQLRIAQIDRRCKVLEAHILTLQRRLARISRNNRRVRRDRSSSTAVSSSPYHFGADEWAHPAWPLHYNLTPALYEMALTVLCAMDG